MQELAALLGLPSLPPIGKLTTMSLDSRSVTVGCLFVAIKGHQTDGRNYITQALQKGASAVLFETDSAEQHLIVKMDNGVPLIGYYELAKHLSQIAGQFYDNPSHKLTLVGVTGTNGKTTVSQLLAQWTQLLSQRSAVMGTIGNGLFGEIKEGTNTTGSAVEIQQNLADFVKQGADFVAMEVSSHGLVQQRVEALQFAVGIFTNLTRDHLDYHKTMKNYTAAKKRLFTELKCDIKIINGDDSIGHQWLMELPQAVAVSCNPDYQLGQHRCWLQAEKVTFNATGAIIVFRSSWGNGVLHSPLIGVFNVSNLLLAMATLLALGHDLHELIETVSQLKGVSGRMEMLNVADQPTVIVDYAHTPDALEKALQASRIHCHGKLYCVFGCGGDRDRGKRPLMAEVAEKLADFVIVTDDNPRTENPAQIMQDIQQGFTHLSAVTIIHDRKLAITEAIKSADQNDVILIAGKGHENYQIIGTEKQYFSDQEVVNNLFKK